MPSKSPKQARFMAAAAHNPAFALKSGIQPSVAREFNQADKGSGILNAKKPKPKWGAMFNPYGPPGTQ
jgi:hypothetical protein